MNLNSEEVEQVLYDIELEVNDDCQLCQSLNETVAPDTRDDQFALVDRIAGRIAAS